MIQYMETFYRHHTILKKSKRKVQGVPQSQTVALPRHQEEEETDKSKPSTNRTNARKALRLALSSSSEVIAMLKGLKNTRKLVLPLKRKQMLSLELILWRQVPAFWYFAVKCNYTKYTHK